MLTNHYKIGYPSDYDKIAFFNQKLNHLSGSFQEDYVIQYSICGSHRIRVMGVGNYAIASLSRTQSNLSNANLSKSKLNKLCQHFHIVQLNIIYYRNFVTLVY